jgi:3-oxoacyl-[acyl-carrier-protein] synthase III
MVIGDRWPAARFAGIGHALPERSESSGDIEDRIRSAAGRLPVPSGTLRAISGVDHRRVVGPTQNSSTLAAEAGGRALADAGVAACDVDLLIFASASQDQLEPATSHVVANALGIGGGSVFDVKNACNSFFEGLRVAEALIAQGQVRRALVVTGETPTLAARYQVQSREEYRRAFLGYTVGDVGGAALLEPSDDDRGIFYRYSWSASQHWDVSGVAGGGSRYPKGEFLWAEGDGARLRRIVRTFDPDVALRVFHETGTTVDDYRLFVLHQVTGPFTDELTTRLGLPPERVERTIDEFGNVASGTLPLALGRARDAGRVGPGDRVLFIGLGAGISVGTMAFTL